ncbi:virulence RhuM family protein [Dysgonomonas alginatilytica]|uniref:Virulence RhuM family protein n=1 Tax=Dysgonomonas alginatilytica TaxID=1605892 RepID=A0A2V3PJ52_9BACT|nr:virulence RhuM family protein [Dysgonomonas alginatilytica]PXV60122.1 virulence RhuM family protein [Dysgonomonas alginatilytica]
METGKLYISTDENNNTEVIFKPINGTVWLTHYEIAFLFGVHTQTINNNLRAIFKSGVLREDEVSYTYRYAVNSSNYTERQAVYYNLDAIIALAYRIKSRNAEIFRKWVMDRICRQKESKSAIVFRYDFDNISLN